MLTFNNQNTDRRHDRKKDVIIVTLFICIDIEKRKYCGKIENAFNLNKFCCMIWCTVLLPK